MDFMVSVVGVGGCMGEGGGYYCTGMVKKVQFTSPLYCT